LKNWLHVHYCWDCGDWWQHEDDLCGEGKSATCPMHEEPPKHTGTDLEGEGHDA
jgi:hypothetical protein